MKITATQLRRIIKEEVTRVIKESQEHDSFIEIPDISSHAEDMGVAKFVAMLNNLAVKYPDIEAVGPEGGPAYSKKYDSWHAYGTRSSLEAFARELDDMVMGGAQSIDDEDSFVNAIDYF